jgi:hypothetical protein
MKNCARTFVAVFLFTSSAVLGQDGPASSSGVAQATAIARDNSIAVSIAINGQAIAEAEDGGEALATAIRDAIGNTIDEASAPTPANSDPVSTAANTSRPVELPATAAHRPCVYHLCIRLKNDRIAVLTLTQSQLDCLLKPKMSTNSAGRPKAACSVGKCH